MKTTYWYCWARALVLLISITFAAHASAQSSETELPADPGWPRVFEQGANQVTVYQPQVDSWEGYSRIHYRCAIAVKPGAAKQERYGVVEVSADTDVDQEARTVVTSNHQREVRFPNVPAAEEAQLRQVFDQILPPKNSITVSLDRVLAYLDPDSKNTQQAVEVNLQPPKIFYSRKPAILVMFMGSPQFKPVTAADTSFLFASNSNWDIFFDTANSRYYLLNGESWLVSDDPLNGTWAPAGELPAKLRQLPDDDNWADVRNNVPGKPAKDAPEVFVTTEPAEMIVTEGEPSFLPIQSTKLLAVNNTDSTLFLHSGEGQFYLLVAGRWFRTKTLDGPWTAASTDLPADFLNIPDDNPAAFVKAAVPGTREAQDAVLLASIPQKTAVDVSNPPAVDVVYEGQPQFVQIEGTTVQYAVNTPSQVFLVGGAYYCCNQGVWFNAPAPGGPWGLATSVPPAIYTIPPSNPNYNVTYVVVQQATPTTVVYSHTSGYSGEYVAANGVLMFGMGMLVGAAIADHHHHYWYPPPCYYSYGSRAVYHHRYGGYYSSAHISYGPYGGAGRVAAYNPRTGTYSRGAYRYGPAGSAGFRQAYNPYTGGYAQQARVNTAYGSAGRFYAEQGGKSVSGGYRSGPHGSVGGARTSEGAGAAAWNTRAGQGAVVKTKSGNVYAGRDGNVYKREANGQWQQNKNGSWKNVAPQVRTSGPGPASPRSETINPAAVQQQLNREAKARSWGEQSTARSSGADRARAGQKNDGAQRSGSVKRPDGSQRSGGAQNSGGGQRSGGGGGRR